METDLDPLDRAALNQPHETVADIAQDLQILTFRWVQQQKAKEALPNTTSPELATGADATPDKESKETK